MIRRKPRPWDFERDDPTAGLINLFDVWMVFAVALLLSLAGARGLDKSGGGAATRERADKLDPLEGRSRLVAKMRSTNEEISGEGERLGVAYRLKSGDIVYVPESQSRRP